jgi:ABC-type transport system involved in Fe-S cluster assembly fused permease/ATPase subunit
MPHVALVCDQVGLTCVVLISIYDIWFTIITLVTVVAYVGKSFGSKNAITAQKRPHPL